MHGISMFSSSRDLRHGLHRAAALLVRAARPDATDPWWRQLPDPAVKDGADLAGFRALFADPLLREGAAALGITLPDAARLDRGFADAILSARALSLQGGRDVYGGSNKWLWDAVVAPVVAVVPDTTADPRAVPADLEDAARAHLRTLLAFDTSPAGADHARCAAWLTETLGGLGFAVEARHHGAAPPILVARRPARGLRGSVVMYGHYDVTPPGPGRWRYDPSVLTEAEGRLWARGVGDNKGPLATRIAAVERLAETPAITWVLQGEEETGSAAAHALFPAILGDLRPTAWIDETGYHDHEDGTLRLLARHVAANPAPSGPGPADAASSAAPGLAVEDRAFGALLHTLRRVADAWGIGARHEARGLNKSVVEGGCPFDANLPVGARYVALGINDSQARIHGLDESVPAWTIPLHHAELRALFGWVGSVA